MNVVCITALFAKLMNIFIKAAIFQQNDEYIHHFVVNAQGLGK